MCRLAACERAVWGWLRGRARRAHARLPFPIPLYRATLRPCLQFLDSAVTSPASAEDYFACYGLTGQSACQALSCGYSTTVAEGTDVEVEIASTHLTLHADDQTQCVPGDTAPYRTHPPPHVL